MRLIDADALIGQYNKFALTAQTDYAEGVRDVINDINNAPSIDIVRCKECGHWSRNYNICCIDEAYPIIRNENDFCSRGERREQ